MQVVRGNSSGISTFPRACKILRIEQVEHQHRLSHLHSLADLELVENSDVHSRPCFHLHSAVHSEQFENFEVPSRLVLFVLYSAADFEIFEN